MEEKIITSTNANLLLAVSDIHVHVHRVVLLFRTRWQLKSQLDGADDATLAIRLIFTNTVTRL